LDDASNAGCAGAVLQSGAPGGKSIPVAFEVDGVTLAYCQTYAEAAACIGEMIADAAGKPIALDLETCPIASERARLTALMDERAAINAQAIGDRKAAKKAGAPEAEIDAITETAGARLKALDAQIDHAEGAGLDPNRSAIRLLQVYGGGARAAVVDLFKAGAEALGLLQDRPAVIHRPTCESAWNKDPVFGVIGIQSELRG
jgi:hypothetical protein